MPVDPYADPGIIDDGSGTADTEDTDPQPEPEPEPVEVPYVSPIDFDSLQDMNPDIYAYLVIPGSEIEQPVLSREGDADYYINRSPDGKYSSNGSLYTQSTWNKPDFSDSCTIIYGHKMKSGAMFGTLQLFFSDPDNFRDHNELIVYMPDKEIHYRVFAAVPYDNRHLWISYNFDMKENYQRFIDSVYTSKALGANLDENVEFNYQDRMLILSTCLRGNLNKRYLVCALEVKEPDDSLT